MSELIQMRQRMKAVTTIKKVTHAMRLISMAAHGKLRSHKDLLEQYHQHIERLTNAVQIAAPDWQSPLAPHPDSNRELAIVVGSQKGLCGNFNNALISFFAREYDQLANPHLAMIVVGKKAVELLGAHKAQHQLSFAQLSSNTRASITASITDFLMRHATEYRSIKIFYQYPKTFFIQRPTMQELITRQTTVDSQTLQDAWWQYSPAELLTILTQKQIELTIHKALLSSLIAEQAARFIAMDSSTRNASSMLDELKIDYNKLRQAKITRELTDLSGSFF